jgi:hypothetical protein
VIRRVGTKQIAFRFRPRKVRPRPYVLRATPVDAAGNVGRARFVRVIVRR